MVNERACALEVIDVKKAFFNNPVLLGVSFEVRFGEILGLLGANGAGKSTLMKIITGVYKLDSGSISVNGERVDIRSSADARRNGIAMVYQEFSLIPTMTVVQNLFLGREHLRGPFVDERTCAAEAREIFSQLAIDVDPDAAVESLPIGTQQLVEIAKALMQRPSVLILDEPTASLTHSEIERLFDFLGRLREQGIAIILITHHMQEIMDICDRAVVLRGGVVELDSPVSKVSIGDMIEAMVGRAVSGESFMSRAGIDYSAEPLLEAEELRWKNKLNGASFELYKGEVLGIAGLLGSGRTELLKCLYGLSELDSGTVTLDGKKLPRRRGPWESVANGVCFVPENRRVSGIIPIQSIKMNMLVSIWKRYAKGGFIDDKAATLSAEDMSGKLDIRSTGVEQELQNLSGGNQQKVVFGKGLFAEPSVMLLDDPMAGIDVEAKESIGKIIRSIADAGSGVIIVSSEIEQLEKLCDRVLVLRDGRVERTLTRGEDDLSEAAIIHAIQT